MKSSSLIVGFIIGLLIGTLAGYGSGSASTREEIVSLKNEVSSLKNEQQDLTAKLSDLQKMQAISQNTTLIAVSFSRTQDTSSLLQYWISRANQSIKILMYSFTQDALGNALITAKTRGVSVRVYMEGENVQSQGSEYSKLQAAGIPVKADSRSGLMHHKVVTIDDCIIVIGSYNWSQAAEDENDENVIILKSQAIAQIYIQEFNRLWG